MNILRKKGLDNKKIKKMEKLKQSKEVEKIKQGSSGLGKFDLKN